ncbi:hypothetical protein V2V24_31265, partial [Pseudomonas aeruginosa]
LRSDCPAGWPWNRWPDGRGMPGQMSVDWVAGWRGIRSEQLRCLQSIMQGLYGDGRIVTSDARRDLANRLHQLIGVIQAQTIEIDV